MAISYFGEQESFVLNHVRNKKLRDGFLLTTDYGSWAYLNDEEFNQLKKNKLEEPLFSLLKEKGIILNESNVDNIIDDYRKRCGYLFQGTSLHIIIPTLKNNIKSTLNNNETKSANMEIYDMDETTAKKTVDFIFQSPSKDITIRFQGGEPLLNFKIIKYIINYSKVKNENYNKDLKFNIISNLTLMNDDILDFLIKEDVEIYTYFDGFKEVHDKNWQEYDKTLHWIKIIKKNYDIKGISLVAKHSLPYYKEIIDGYTNLGLDTIEIKPFNNKLNSKGISKNIEVSADEFLIFWKNVLDYIVKINKKFPIKEEFTLKLLKKILQKKDAYSAELGGSSGAALSQLAYTPKGEVFYTNNDGQLFDIFKLGTVDNKHKELLTSKEAEGIVRASLNEIPVYEISAYKPYFGLCPVNAYAESDNILTSTSNKRFKILESMFDHIFEKLLFDEDYRNVFMGWLEEESIVLS